MREIVGDAAPLANTEIKLISNVVHQKDAPVRFLVCGDVDGQFESLAKNIENVEKKQGPFTFVLCVGDFLGNKCDMSVSFTQNDDDYLAGRQNFPLPVYFIDSSFSQSGSILRCNYINGFRFSKTLEFLGGFGFKQLHGLTIGYLSGLYNVPTFFTGFEDEEDIDINDDVAENNISNVKKQKYFGGDWHDFYCRPVLQNLKSFGEQYRGATDLFISCTWPSGLDENLTSSEIQDMSELLSRGQEEYDQPESSPALSELLEYFEPRFHVAAGGNVFYQRKPFRSSCFGLTSKFVGLGRLSSAAKLTHERRLRFLHALVLIPISSFGSARTPLLAVPCSTTPSPYFTMYNPNSTTHTNFETSPPHESKRTRTFFTECSNDKFDTGRRAIECPIKKPRINSENMMQQSTGQTWDNNNATTSNNLPISTVFVSNMPFDISEESLLEIMASFGEIVSANVPKTPEGRSTGKAWITYKIANDARAAVAATEQLQSGGRLLRIQHSRRPENGWGDDRRNSSKGRQMTSRHGNSPIQVDLTPHSGTNIEKTISDCWFCLANPQSEKGLIISVGHSVYVALAKGGLVHQHVLVVPVAHLPNSLYCTPAVATEMENYITNLRACYRSQGLATIVFERFFPMRQTTGMHMQLQVIPVPTVCVPKCLEVFERRAERAGCPLRALGPDETFRDIGKFIADKMNYPFFYVDIPVENDQIARRLFTCSAESNTNLPFNFGREAIADLMSVPERANWKSCVESPQVETQLAQRMQKLFQPFANTQE